MGARQRVGIVIAVSIILVASSIPATMSSTGEAAAGTTTFTDDFSDTDLSEYEIVRGNSENWKLSEQIDGNSLHADFSDEGNGEILIDPDRFQWAGDRTIETDFQAEDRHWKKNAIIVFYDEGDRWAARVGVQGDAVTLNGPSDVSEKTPTSVDDGAVHHLRVEIEGNQIQVFLDGERYITHEHGSSIGAGPVGLSTQGENIAHETWFDNLEVSGENVAETPGGQLTSTNPPTATGTQPPSPTTASPPAGENDEERTSILDTSGALLGGIGGMAVLGLGGFVLLRRGNDDDDGETTAAAAGGAGSPVAMNETEDASEARTSDSTVPEVGASRREPPSPSEAETDVEDISPAMDAEEEPEEGGDGDATPEEDRSPNWEQETQSAGSDPAPAVEGTPADPLGESLQEQLESEAPGDRIDALEAIGTRAAAGEIDTDAAVDVLDHQLQAADDSDVRVAVIEALGSIGGDRAVSLLEYHRLDTDTAVSKAASKTLRDLEP